MVYRIDTEGEMAAFVNYINTRDFSEDPSEVEQNLTSDVAPEGLCFIPESGILLAAFEVSGTVSAYAVTAAADQPDVPKATLPLVDNVADAANSGFAWMIVIAAIAVMAVAVILIRKK